MTDPSQMDAITYNNDYAGSYMYDKKRRKMVYEDEIADADRDGMNDKWERDQGLHDPHTNRHRHLNIGGNLKMGPGGMTIPHDLLTPIKKNKGFKLTINSPKPMLMKINTPAKPMKYSIDLKSPNMKKVNIKTTLNDGKIKTPSYSIGDSFIKNHLAKILNKYKKKRKVK